MVNEFEIKKQICDIGRRIYNRNMVAANDGNISVKLNDNEFLCTPTGVSKGFMTPEFICKVDAQGNVIQANPGFKPSSEIKMHMRVYQKRPDVGSVVHAHPIYATSFAIAGIPLTQPIMPEAVIALGAGLGIWGVINLLEGYGNDNPGAKSQGIKQLMAGGGVALIGTILVPLLSGLFG